MGIADYPANTGDIRQFLGSALGVAPGDNDLTIGILAVDSTDGIANVLIRRRGYGARIEHDDLGFLGLFGTGQPTLNELALNGSAICLSGAASEIFHVEAGHDRCYHYAIGVREISH